MTTAHSQGVWRDWLVGEEKETEAGRSGGECRALRRCEGPRARDTGDPVLPLGCRSAFAWDLVPTVPPSPFHSPVRRS